MPKTTKTIREPKVASGKEGYCRKCEKTLPLEKFFEATNPFLDSNGYLSVCKDCCNGIYYHYYSIYSDIKKSIQLTCQDLDVRFSIKALEQAQSQIDKLLSNGKKADAVFGTYKSKLSSTTKKNESMDCFRYKDSDCSTTKNKIIIEDLETDFDDGEIDDDLLLFWGKGFSFEDIVFLEAELSNWKQTHKCDNQAEITLLKEICIKILAIRTKREKSESASNDLKELQDLMKTASVDPAKANAASAGKSHDCFGLWVKDIEQFKPAEWYEKQEKYQDMDGFIPYIKNYIVRPIENFLTGIRNFFVDDNIDADLDSVDIGNSEDDAHG
jgi:hypothetical protein